MIKLSLTGSAPFIELSKGTGLIPLEVAVELDGAGGFIYSVVVKVYIAAINVEHDSTTVDTVNPETGVTWELSLDGSLWTTEVLGFNRLSADSVLTIHARAKVANDGSVAVLQNKTACNIKLQSREVF